MTHAAALQAAATSTFEELTFTLPSPAPDEVQAAAPLAAAVAVAFSGAAVGELRMFLYGPLLPQLAANMLGTAEPPLLALQRDAIGEIANVICGNVLPAVAGADAVFRLNAPRVELGAAGTGAAARQVATDAAGTPGASTVIVAAAVTFGLEEGRVELDLRFEA